MSGRPSKAYRDLSDSLLTLEVPLLSHVVIVNRCTVLLGPSNFAKEPKLLVALTPGADWASLSTSEARVEYWTGFDLTAAPKLISDPRAQRLR
ncbi:hypothetical protein DC415_15575 [Agrobacterium tumefaciens]|uniref:Uncharacterized protein n=1 Tax=Rhizobium rhizogenes TaxID=359 RepID=A0AA92BYF6_RHIRH|nr:hypothetical protein DC430_24100 [Rhizobium rhizogenes]PVE63879.1 hypothetical protein DC415_15575 [Agrobacterium tumefaciens]PVE73142.1 hypothetical protein DCP16_15575 [Sphingomonas sp. TPD3009]